MGKERIKLLSKQRIPVSPEIIRRLSGDPSAALYYRQLQYYDKYSEKDDGWFDRSSPEIENDTGLNRRRQMSARVKLEKIGWIETQSIQGGLKPTCMFRIITDFY